MHASNPAGGTRGQGGPFGVCAAIGADFGFHPDILRVVLAAGLLWNPVAVIAFYAFAALLMGVGRWLFPVDHRTPHAGADDAFRAVRPVRAEDAMLDAIPEVAEALAA